MLKITLEVGHVAQRKRVVEKGFTHDWELFVKSPIPDADLSLFIDKVVFNLHNTFVKPKRTIKEQPFVIKESGYAAFEVFIEIYLKNRDEPRKLKIFSYDLDLQPYKSELKEFIIDTPISEEFRRKIIKGGGCLPTQQQQQRDPSSSHKSVVTNNSEVKKPSKQFNASNNSMFTDLFGAPIEKSQIPSKTTKTSGSDNKNVQPSNSSIVAAAASTTVSSSSTKEKSEKSKHKHSSVVDSKETKKTTESSSRSEKVKKDKLKDRDRSDKKEKSSKRPASPPTRMPVQSNTAATSSKTQIALVKPQTPIQDTSSSSGNKAKKADREKKEYLKSSKEKPVAASTVSLKERDLILPKSDERQKQKSESKNVPHSSGDSGKKHNSSAKELEKKHKHKKKDKKEAVQDVTPEKRKKSSREEKGSATKGSTEKEDKQSKRKTTKEDRDSSASPPLPKQSKREFSPVSIIEKNIPDPHASNNNNNNNNTYSATDVKVPNEYLDELKDLKQKINLLQTKELHHVVRLIASTGFYEITKSSFNFDLVQLDKNQPGIISQLNKLVAGSGEDKKETK